MTKELTPGLGEMAVSDYVPTAEDLVRLSKNKVSEPPKPPDPPEKPIEERLSLIPPSKAKQTMAEMERGRLIVEQAVADRKRRLGL